MQHDPNFRQIAMWIDANSIEHYQTLFTLEQLVDLLNKDATKNFSTSFRPYFNIYRNPEVSGQAVKPDVEDYLKCARAFPEYCIDSQVYGTAS